MSKGKSKAKPKARASSTSMKKGRKPMRRIGKWFLVINLIFALSLLISWGCTYIDPSRFWPAAFIAISYPFLIIINLLFTLVWLMRIRWQFIISLIPIVLSFNLLGAYFQFGGSADPTEEQNTRFKVVSYNVHGFNKNEFYNHGDYKSGNQIFNWLYSEDADLLCIQEFYSNPGRDFNMMDTFLMMDRYPHWVRTPYRDDWKTMSLMLFSRYPVLDEGRLSDNKAKTYAQWADVLMNGDTLRVLNVHLRSIYLSQEINMLDKLEGSFYNDEEFRKGTRSLLGKMKAAFIHRAQQTRALRDFISDSPFPVLLCGDLNDTPASYTYRMLRNISDDAFQNAGTGSGRTYNGKLPSFRIDYMMHSKEMRTLDYSIGRIDASDHFPLSAELELLP
jgi:endonuclease/exonuclease/phosphatase family metal-dependent hydrolase